MSCLQSSDSARVFESYLISSEREGKGKFLWLLYRYFWGFSFSLFWVKQFIKHFKLGTNPSNLIREADSGTRPQTRADCQNAFLPKDFEMDGRNKKKVLQNRRNAVLTEASWKYRLFFDSFPTSLPLRLHVAHLSIKMLILDEDNASTCSNGCMKSMPTLKQNLPALSNCYGMFLCAVPPGQRRTLIKSAWQTWGFPDEQPTSSFKVRLVGCWWKDNSMTRTVENIHQSCCSSALDI